MSPELDESYKEYISCNGNNFVEEASLYYGENIRFFYPSTNITSFHKNALAAWRNANDKGEPNIAIDFFQLNNIRIEFETQMPSPVCRGTYYYPKVATVALNESEEVKYVFVPTALGYRNLNAALSVPTDILIESVNPGGQLIVHMIRDVEDPLDACDYFSIVFNRQEKHGEKTSFIFEVFRLSWESLYDDIKCILEVDPNKQHLVIWTT